MSKGENIFKRKDGRWEARYVKGRGLDGRIQYGFCYGKSYREAKEKVMLKKGALLFGVPEETGGKKLLGRYADDWLRASRNQVKESTYVKYETILDKHIKPRLGNCRMDTVTQEVISAFSAELLEQMSPKSAKDVLVVLHSVLKYSGCSSCTDIPYPREQRQETRVLTAAEQKKLTQRLSQSSDRRDLGILLALLTGMRIGELCALRWDAVSLTERTIAIRGTMQRLKNSGGGAKTKVVISPPKSEKSRRTIPMTELAAQVCLKLGPGTGFVLTGTEDCVEPRAMQYRLSKITAECGLEGVHFHTLRHTFATRCVEVGFEIKSLSEILGHSGTGITLDRYIHASLALKRENMGKLEGVGM